MARQRGAVGAGVLLGLVVLAGPGRADEAAVVKMVEELEGFVRRDAKRPGKPVVDVGLSFTKVTDTDLKELMELKRLKELSLGGTKITDAGLKELKELTSLQTLNVQNTPVTHAGIEELQAALPGLRIIR